LTFVFRNEYFEPLAAGTSWVGGDGGGRMLLVRGRGRCVASKGVTAPGLREGVTLLAKDKPHRYLQSNFVEKVSEQSGAFYFLLRLGSIMEEPSFY